MQRCPECNSLFPDTDHFCELDGTTLEPTAVLAPSPPSQNLLPIVAVAGVVLGALLFLVYLAMTRKKPAEQPEAATTHIAQAQLPVRPLKPVNVPSPTPTVEASPSPTPEPSPSPSPQSTPKRVQLSSNPISTAIGSKDKTGPVVIKLDSGVVIEADEAWQTTEGIWYRKSGVVSLLNPINVKAIEKPVVATSQPTASPKTSP